VLEALAEDGGQPVDLAPWHALAEWLASDEQRVTIPYAKALAEQIRHRGCAKEVHVRVACPPIVSPCFYGIDMSTMGELFAPKFVGRNYTGSPTPEMQKKMAKALKIDSLRYLAVEDIAKCIGIESDKLCRGCVTTRYPTEWGKKHLRRARRQVHRGQEGARTYE